MEFGLYQHYKGKFYLVLDIARHSETLEEMVVYQALYGDYENWVRPKKMFEENVTLASGQVVPRFALITAEEEGDDDDLITVFDNQLELKRALKQLDAHDLEYDVLEEKLDPKPEHFKHDTVYKLFVAEEDFEEALDVLKHMRP